MACIFYPNSCVDNWCTARKNTDKTARKYILINEQQEGQTMQLKLEDGKKYVTEEGEIITVQVQLGVPNTEEVRFNGSNSWKYLSDGSVFSDGRRYPRNIVKEYIEETKQEPEGHVHAELMLEYGKLALTSKTPWTHIQMLIADGIWITCERDPDWVEDISYRLKPKTITINGYEVPEPLRVAPEEETIVYIPSLATKDWGDAPAYNTDSFTISHPIPYRFKVLLMEGICHLTQEAAELHAKALLSFTTMEKL